MESQYKQARTIDYVFRGCRVIMTELTRRSDGYRIEVITTSVTDHGVAVADKYETRVRYDFAPDFSSCSEIDDEVFTGSEADAKAHHVITVGKVLEDRFRVAFRVVRKDDIQEREETSMLYGEWLKRTTLEWRGRTVEIRTAQAKNAVHRYQTVVKENRRIVEKHATVNEEEKESSHEAAVSSWIAILARDGGRHD